MTTTTSTLLSLRNTVVCGLAAAALFTVAACDKGSDPGAAATTTTTGAAAAPAAAAKPKATVKLADLNAVYKTEIDNSKMSEPMPKKVAAFLAKIGKPSLDEGRTKTWYTLDGASCSKVVLDTQDGSLSSGTTAKSDCGM